MIVAEYLPPRPHVLWQLARQMGIRHAIVNVAPELPDFGYVFWTILQSGAGFAFTPALANVRSS